MRATAYLALGAVATAALLVGVGALGTARARSDGVSSAGRTLDAPIAKLGRYELGTTHAWRMVATVGVGLEQGRSPEPVRVSATFSQTATDILDGTRVVVQTQLEAPEIELSVAGADDVASGAKNAKRELARLLATPFYALYDGRGLLRELRFPAGMQKSAQDLLGAFVAASQFSGSVEESSVHREQDLAGDYLAAYERQPAGGYVRRKLDYLGGEVSGGRVAKVAIVSARTEFDHVVAGFPGRVSVNEKLRISVEGVRALAFDSLLSLTLEQARTTRSPALAGAFSRETARFSKRALGRQTEADEAALTASAERVLGEDTLASLRKRLEAAGSLPAAALEAERRELTSKLKALFRVDPKALEAAGELVRREPLALGGAVFGALTLVDSEPTARALLGLVEDGSLESSQRERALRGLIRSSSVPKAADAVLMALASGATSHATVAEMGVGAVAHRVRSSDPERAAVLDAFLIRALERPKDRAAAKRTLRALGNAGDPASLPALAVVIRGSDAELARGAIDALRRIQHPDADRTLQELFADPLPAKRRAAIEALRQRELGPYIEGLVSLARRDADENVRAAAVQALGKRLSSFPTLAPFLRERAEKDAAEQVRNQARRLLGAPASQGETTPGAAPSNDAAEG